MKEPRGWPPDFRALFESAVERYLVVEPDSPRFTVIAASDAYARALDKTPQQLLGRGLFDALAEGAEVARAAAVRRLVSSLERVVASGAAEVMPVCKSEVPEPGPARSTRAKPRWCRPVSVPVLGGSGELSCIIHRVDDVTDIVRGEQSSLAAQRGEAAAFTPCEEDSERKRLEHHLRLAEARSTGILTIAADGIISVDEQQRITMFNEGAESIFGYAKAEVIGVPLDLLIPERFRAIHREHVERFSTGLEVARRMRGAEIYGLRKSGEEFPADAAISKLDVGGRKVLTVVLRDITEVKRIEREQRFLAEVGPVLGSTLEYEDTLSKLAELAVREIADVAIIDIVDDEGEVRRLRVLSRDPGKRRACQVLTRIPLDRARPHLVWAALTSKQPILVKHVTHEMLASWAQNEEHLRALCGLAPRSMIAVPLIARGSLLGVLALVSSAGPYDDSDLHLAQELAHRAALSIENARLYLAAKRAIHARDEVLGIVAHDLRNPLNSIAIQAALLRRVGVDEQRRQKPADIIERAAKRMKRLIEDLLDVTCMEAGHPSLERSRLGTRRVVLDALEAQTPLAASAGLELHSDLERDVPDVWADRDRLLQVFENLIGNALKFTPPGGRITVGAAPQDDEVLFWVGDTGGGIRPEDVPRLFDRFWQKREAARQGAGLGLPITKGIVEAHGGHVWVESVPGQGSKFSFTIPAAPHAKERREVPDSGHLSARGARAAPPSGR